MLQRENQALSNVHFTALKLHELALVLRGAEVFLPAV